MTADVLRQALGLILLALVGGYALLFASRTSTAFVRAVALSSFVAHAVVAGGIWFLMPTLIAGDAFVYDAQALGSVEARAGKEGFSIVLGAIYRALGPSPVAGLLLNAIFMGLLVLVVARTASRFAGTSAASAAAIMAAVLPPFVWWGSQLLREASMWLLIALAADVAVAMAMEGLSWRRGAGLIAICLGMLTIRAPVAAVITVTLALGLVLASTPRPGDHIRRAAMIAGAIGLALFLFPRFSALQSLQEEDSASLVYSRNYLATANTGFGEEAVPTTGGLIGQLPSALPLVTLGPLPWQLPSSGLAAVADTFAWWFVLYWGLRGLAPVRRSFGRATWLLILPAVALLGALALTLANFGIVIRMRAMVVVLLLPYAAVGLAVAAARRRQPAPDRRPVRVLSA